MIRANDFFRDLMFEGDENVESYHDILKSNDNFRTWITNILNGSQELNNTDKKPVRKLPFKKRR